MTSSSIGLYNPDRSGYSNIKWLAGFVCCDHVTQLERLATACNSCWQPETIMRAMDNHALQLRALLPLVQETNTG